MQSELEFLKTIDSYKFFDEYLHKIFIEGKSFITKENEVINFNDEINAIKKCFTPNPDAGLQDFNSKLQKQFANESPSTRLAFTNIYYIYMFAPTNISKNKKIENLEFVLQDSINKNLVPRGQQENNGISHGLCKFGMYYNMNKYFEIYSIIQIFKYLLHNKNSYSDIAGIKALIEDFCIKAIYNKSAIEEYLPKKDGKIHTCNMYNALLHLSNPKYELTLAYAHKEKIVNAFSNKYLPSNSNAKNTDEKIIEIKQAIIDEGKPWGWKNKHEKIRWFFYDSKLREEWFFRKEVNLKDRIEDENEKSNISDDRKRNATAKADYIIYQRKELLCTYKPKHFELEQSFQEFLENTLEEQNLNSIKKDINYIDYQFKNNNKHYICELKPSNKDQKSIKYSIRSALGQLLEYSYNQEQKSKVNNICKIIVFQNQPSDKNLKFLKHLQERFEIYYLYEEHKGVFKGNILN